MINALFVDDDLELLESLRRSFFSRRNRLNILIAKDSTDARSIARSYPIDVVISDMRLPGESGTDVLHFIRTEAPGAVRVILSGYSDPDDALASISVAHQFLSKPTDANTLADIIFLCCEWRDRVKDPILASAVINCVSFSSSPTVMREFVETLNNEPTAAQLASITKQDPALTIRFLQLQRSTFFGASRDTTDLLSSISLLRFDTVRELLNTPGFYRTDDDLFPVVTPVVHEARERCVRAAEKAADRAQNRGANARETDEAWIVGLLSGMGALAVAELMPEKYGDGSLQQHAAISVLIAHLWGLPTTYCAQLEAFADGLHSNFVGSFSV